MLAASQDDEIAAVLKLLEDENPRTAAVAGEALAWITGGDGPAVITQDRIQTFCWLDLPARWPMSCEEKREVTAALGRALRLLELPRYAAICASTLTAEIMATYELDGERGVAAFRQAAADSGIAPPGLPEVGWSDDMGPVEASVWASASQMLEQAVIRGELVPGARGWRNHQQELTRVYLHSGQAILRGQTRAQVIFTERAVSWVSLRRSETRFQVMATLAGKLLRPAQLPPGTADPLPPLMWLLGQFGEGVKLTRAGNLSRAFVQRSAERFGWLGDDPPRAESAVHHLHMVRCFVERLRLVERAGGTMTLTGIGRELLSQPGQLCRVVAAGLLLGHGFPVYAGELFLALLLTCGPASSTELTDVVVQAAREEGFRDGLDRPVSESYAMWAIWQTSDLCQAVGMLDGNGYPRYSLTPAGAMVALEALRAVAIGPRDFRPGEAA